MDALISSTPVLRSCRCCRTGRGSEEVDAKESVGEEAAANSHAEMRSQKILLTSYSGQSLKMRFEHQCLCALVTGMKRWNNYNGKQKIEERTCVVCV